jgi:hypothetical protein
VSNRKLEGIRTHEVEDRGGIPRKSVVFALSLMKDRRPFRMLETDHIGFHVSG